MIKVKFNLQEGIVRTIFIGGALLLYDILTNIKIIELLPFVVLAVLGFGIKIEKR